MPADNRILASLTPADSESIRPLLELVPLCLNDMLFKEGATITHAYFPVSGMISLVMNTDRGGVESATVGSEGVLGLLLSLEAEVADNDCVVQIKGEAWRVPAAAFLRLIDQSPELSIYLKRYTAARLWVGYRSAACNLMHSVAQRCARWLLLVHDQVGADDFDLTHRYLAQMLGVRRAGVTIALGVLQRKGIVRSRRGRITILDRERLEAESCECDALIRARRKSL